VISLIPVSSSNEEGQAHRFDRSLHTRIAVEWSIPTLEYESTSRIAQARVRILSGAPKGLTTKR
jgi:hypothetical protein